MRTIKSTKPNSKENVNDKKTNFIKIQKLDEKIELGGSAINPMFLVTLLKNDDLTEQFDDD